jgi:hypothetical protein
MREIVACGGAVSLSGWKGLRVSFFWGENQMTRKLLLMKQADDILKKANCDALTGEKKDREYKRKKQAENRAYREFAKSSKRFGKLGAASRLRWLSAP